MREARLNGAVTPLDVPDAHEPAWLDSARDGDAEAFNHLVRRYQANVFNLCYRTLSDQEDAADACQEAFLSAFRALSSFRGGSFKSWLLRIAVNACYDTLRRRQRRGAESLDALLDESNGEQRLPDPALGPEPVALCAETAATIQEGLSRLSDDMRLAIVLCDVQGFSYEEAALALAVPIGTVKSRLSRGRSQLRDFLASRGELPVSSQRLY